MTDKIKKEGSFSALTGYKKIIPFILGILALFLTFCFITQSTGALGGWFSRTLLGLFSIGAYFIPGLLLIHALAYPRDTYKGRVLRRTLLTVLALILISMLSHNIANLGSDYTLEPKQFYSDGALGEGGGFIGGFLAFIFSRVVGSVGVFIITIGGLGFYLVYTLYTFKAAISKAILKILTAIENRKARLQREKELREAIEEEKREVEDAKRQNELLNDDFFSSGENLAELTVAELGIKEVKSEAAAKSAATNDPLPTVTEALEEPKTRRGSFDYGMGAKSLPSGIDSNRDTRYNRSAYGLDENAEDVFSGDFNGFDFKINQELAGKPSSRKNEVRVQESVTEITSPVNRITAEEVEKARRRADVEMKKKAMREAQEEIDKINSNLPEEQTLEFGAPPAEAVPETPKVEEAPKVVEIPQVAETPKVVEEPQVEAPKAEEAPKIVEAAKVEEAPKAEDAPIAPPTESMTVETAIPSFEFNTSFNDVSSSDTIPTYIPTPTPEISKVEAESEPIAEKNEEPHSAPAPEAQELQPTEKETDSAPELKEFIEEAENDTVPECAEETLLISREMLEVESENEDEDEEGFTFEIAPEEEASEERESMSFEFSTADDEDEPFVFVDESDSDEDAEDEENEQISPLQMPEEESDGDDSYYEEIPEEEQNPDVQEYRKRFSFLEDEEKPAEDENPNNDIIIEAESDGEPIILDTNEEDTPPFDIVPAPALLEKPRAEAPKKSEEAPKPDYSKYKFPPIDLLRIGQVEEDENAEEETKENAEKLVETLAQFNVKVSLKGYDRGPRITRYEIVPAKGVKVNQVTNLFDDIALNMAADGIRMEAPIPGKSAIGIEIPNKKPSLVYLRDLIETEDFAREESKTCAAIGKDVTGNPVFGDISKMPHVLIAGATGMGKSVCINAVLISILYKARPDEVKFIMIDPKRVEFNSYNGIPHLLIPVVTEVKQAAGALMWAVEQMEKRYDAMGALEVKKLDEYNELVRENPALGEPLPKIIIVIDELNDIMLQARKPVEGLIMAIAQKARAAGIHLILGTQRPSVDVITGVIKSNIPSRISCKVMSFQDSKTIIDQAGADKLLNNGDMLYFPNGSPKPLRVQGAFVSNSEVSNIMKFLKEQTKGQQIYDQKALDEINNAAKKCIKNSGDDEDEDGEAEENSGILNDQQFLDAVDLAIKSGKISTSLIQRRISIGYGKAAKFIDYMEDLGIVSEPNGQKPRDILITKDDWHEMLSRRALD